MKQVIGIIQKRSKSETGRDILLLYEAVSDAVRVSGGIPIGIEASLEYIDICDGFIFQGGDDIEDKDLCFMRQILKMNKPILGICLGMQEIGCLFGGRVVKANHLHHSPLNRAHKVYINKKSKLYQITGINKMLVNSRHHDRLICSHLYVSAISEDGVIEAIEIPGYKFCIGVQWHPENLITFDKYSQSLFKEFINSCKEWNGEFKWTFKCY